MSSSNTRVLSAMLTSLGIRQTPVPLGGATGAAWRIGDQVLRIGPSTQADRELAAATAASTQVKVPQTLARIDIDGLAGVVTRFIPARPVADLSGCTLAQAKHRGEQCGRLHQAIALSAVPCSITPVVSPSYSTLPGDDGSPALLHLDLHPHNVLIDTDGELVVIDWANAAAGPVELDVARTASILTYDPAARARTPDPQWRELLTGWSTTAGWVALPDTTITWALTFMLDDLQPRHRADELLPIRSALTELGRRP